MPQLMPFRGLRYDRSVVPDASAVICPPYDVISAADREVLARRHPANAVHVELPESYASAAEVFAQWQRDGTLRRDERPLMYVYEQRYTLTGDERQARGFFCRLRLEALGPASGVRRHELTMAAPKEDRLRLLRAVGANLSPVVLLYEGPADVGELLDGLTTGEPDAQAIDDAGIGHRLWAVDPAQSSASARLLAAAARCPLTVADGHHRYETALRHCAEAGGDGPGYVLALLFDAYTGGLALLPTHRLVRGLRRDLLDEPPAAAVSARRYETVDGLWEAASDASIAVWTRGGGMLLEFDGDELPVERLDQLLAEMLGLGAAEMAAEMEDRARVDYTHDRVAAVAAVASGAADGAFLLRPPTSATVLRYAAQGRVMPRKSTYFYPKAATGLVFNVLDG